MMPDWFFPVLSLMGSLILCTALIVALIFDRFNKLQVLILENRGISDTNLSSYRAQVLESFAAVRERLTRIEAHLGLNGVPLKK